MTSADRNNDLGTAQEKLEWVTPKISLMGAGDTEGGAKNGNPVETCTPPSLVTKGYCAQTGDGPS